MTKVELHVLAPDSGQCCKQYVSELLLSYSRYSQVSLCVDTAEQADEWRTELHQLSSFEVFDQTADTPQIPFQGEVLVNISSQVSPLFSAFQQAIDLVADTESARAEGRVRYLFYRDRGYPLRHITVKNKELQT